MKFCNYCGSTDKELGVMTFDDYPEETELICSKCFKESEQLETDKKFSKKCVICGREFSPVNHRSRFCSKKCIYMGRKKK